MILFGFVGFTLERFELEPGAFTLDSEIAGVSGGIPDARA
jgi:hypothetical protein